MLAHSHGYQGFAGNSSFLMRWFASHGWVVVAPDHVGNTLTTHVDPLPTGHYLWRPLDISAALDAVESDPTFGPVVNTQRVPISGHSFGAYTTWASAGATFDLAVIAQRCADEEMPAGGCTLADETAFEDPVADPRVVASIPLAGTYRDEWFGVDGFATVQGPVLSITGSEDGPEGNAQQWDDLSGGLVDVTWVDVQGGCHQLSGFGGCEHIEDDEGFPIVAAYALAFARAHALGDDTAEVVDILSGAVDVSPLVSFARAVSP